MSQQYLSEIRMMAFQFPPKGWALCNGQTLSIQQNSALFALLGTTYGGNGVTTFALPNLQSRVPVHFGNGITQGEAAGVEGVTLLTTQMPQHIHAFFGTTPSGPVERPPPGGLLGKPAAGSNAYYASDATTVGLAPISLDVNGSSQPHSNIQPYLVMNFCIALQGIFPSRN
jgi:microcystin-dependent protein